MRTKKTLAVAAAVAVGGLILAGCGGNGTDNAHDGSSMGGSPTSDRASSMHQKFNDADVEFATDMISHHRQAVQLAGMAATRAQSADVKQLAATIKAAQEPEIKTMSGWLKAWGEPVPGDMSGMDMSSSMPGMMSTQDMNKLEAASGASFDQMFLDMMIKHHQGAIEMARTEQRKGSHAGAIQMAKDIAAAQTAEITHMRGMLR
jgi:uncharacterized protein (DUF305 family)